MANCLICTSLIGDPNMRYHVNNMESELTSAIELRIGHEVQDGEICEECFNSILANVTTNNMERPMLQDAFVCVWCRSSLYRRRSHAIPNSPQRVIISQQISPRIITDGALVCYACWVEASRIAQSQNIERRMTEVSENTNVCVLCVVSLSNRRSHGLPLGRERNYVATAIHPREIPLSGRVCWNCWRFAQRNATGDSQEHPLNYDCAGCRSSLIRRPYRLLGNGPERIELSRRVFPRQIHVNAHVCLECWSNIQVNEEVNVNELPELPTIPSMELNNFKRAVNSSRHCFVPECTNIERHVVPEYLRKHIFKSKQFYVGKNCRVCDEHIELFNWDILDQFDFSNNFNQIEIEDMLQMNLMIDENVPINFEILNDYSDNVIKYWTGVTKSQFFDILREIPSLNATCKTPKTALGVYLIKSRTGDSHDRIASLFQMSKTKLIKLLKLTREALKTEFVPRHIGLSHIDREQLIGRNLLIPEGLFGDGVRKPIVICDGSYIYVQKSSNYLFQKKTYSLHKHSNLIKPFLIVACDGHIVDVQGPYAATMSDADIMKQLFENENSEHRNFFIDNDVFILDRGFRDALPLLESLNYRIFKPESVDRGETQLSTMKANKSRYVTLCRWVIEIVNGRFKRDFKLFRQDFFNLASRHLFDDFKICAALINAFHPVIENRPDAQLLLDRALSRINMPNTLADLIISHNINRRRAHFVNINAHNAALDIFPQMTISDLIMFSLGTYQIKQAKSYYGEHIRQNGSFEVEISNELQQLPALATPHEALLLRGRIKSRHQASKLYNTYILLRPGFQNWENIINGYYCSCICGKRTVGCCSHVMTIVWYLGWARHQPNIEPPANFLDGILVEEED